VTSALVLGSTIFDIAFYLDRAPTIGTSLIATGSARSLGGKGYNQAVALRRLGLDVALVTGLGTDVFGEMFEQACAAQAIDLPAPVVADVPTGIAAPLISPDGTSTIVVDMAASDQVSDADVVAALASGTWDLVVAQNEFSVSGLEAAAEWCARTGTRFVFSPAPWRSESADVVRRADLLILNEVEAGELLDEFATARPEPAHDLATACLAAVGNGSVIVTLGAEGAVGNDGNGAVRAAAFPVEPVDTTGAGDAFTAAAAMTFAAGRDLATQLRYGCAAGAIACTRRGSGPSMPGLAELEALAESR